MSQNALRPRLADLALATYLAPLLQGKRVAVAGTTSGEVARRARALGAHTVVSFGGVGEDIAVRALTPGAIAAFHGRLDVLLVPDASAVPSLVAVLDEARRALGSDGVVIVGVEPPDGALPMEPTGRSGSTAYHDLHDLCAARFANVRMVGRGPFVGYTLAAFDDASDQVALDTRLIDGDPPRPESFIAIASDGEVSLDPIAVVQVPDTLIEALRSGASKDLEAKLGEAEKKLKEVEAASAERWVKIQRYEHGLKELEEENRKAREKAVRASKDLEDERKLRQRVELEAQMSRRAPELPKAPDLAPELQRAKDELARAEKTVEALRASSARDLAASESELGARDAEIATLRAALVARESELTAAREAGEGRSAEAAKAREAIAAELAAAQARVADLERELDETQSTEAELHAQIEELQAQAAKPRRPDDRAAKELAAARAALDESRAALDASQSALAAARSESDALRAELADAPSHDEVRDLESRLAARAAELTTALAQRDAAATAVRELALTLSRARSNAAPATPAVEPVDNRAGEIRALEERVRSMEAEALAFAGQAQQAGWRIEELEAALAFARAQAAAPAPRDEAATSAEVARLRDELSAEIAAGRGARDALSQARADVARLYAENVALEARMVHRAMELDGIRAGSQRRVSELEHEVERLLRALEVAGAQTAAESQTAREAASRQLELLDAERQGLAYRLREAEAALVARAAAPTPPPAPAAPPPSSFAVEVRADQALADLGRTAERLAETEEALRDARSRVRALESELVEARRGGDPEATRALVAQLDARDLRLAEIEQQHRAQLISLRDALAQAELRGQAQREVLGHVRSNVSAILADGRGALVAHDLMQILRTVEGAG